LLTPAGQEHLAQCQNLRTLIVYLDATPRDTKQLLEQLKSRLPTCEIKLTRSRITDDN